MPRGIPRDKSVNRKVVHRLKIAKGHLEKVISMVEEGEYCIDVINQSSAVRSALKEIDKLILKNHMETCLVDSIRKGQDKKVVSEVMNILNKA